jgi:uroporphyrinogen decarboxylase
MGILKGCEEEDMYYFDKVFETDTMSKKERIIRALSFKPVDRVPIHEQMSFNPEIISHFTGKDCSGFNYTVRDVGSVIRKTLDSCFIPVPPRGTNTYTDEDGFVFKNDNWTEWHISRPFSDEEGARDWLIKKIKKEKNHTADRNPNKERDEYRRYFNEIQALIGDTVFIDFSINTGFCTVFDRMGLELYTYFSYDYPDVLLDFMETSCTNAENKARNCGGTDLSPVVLIAEDFASKTGPLFSNDFLYKFHYPYIKRLTAAWHDTGMKVLYHSDGNYKKVIPDLVRCGVDGFYCLEPNCGMDIIELTQLYPQMVWSGGVDGVDIMERGSPDAVYRVVREQIEKTGVLERGGMLLATSSELNPTIPKENYLALLAAAKPD